MLAFLELYGEEAGVLMEHKQFLSFIYLPPPTPDFPRLWVLKPFSMDSREIRVAWECPLSKASGR